MKTDASRNYLCISHMQVSQDLLDFQHLETLDRRISHGHSIPSKSASASWIVGWMPDIGDTVQSRPLQLDQVASIRTELRNTT